MKEREIELSRKGFVSNYPHFRYWRKPAAEKMLAEEPVNIYIHVPFCAQKCAYCYYKTELYSNPAQLEAYVDALCEEIRLAKARFHFGNRPVHSIYFGGGTPSLLKAELLEKIVQTLKENFNIEHPEFNMEAEPRTITEKKVETYKALGVTRMSIGVQSFCDEVIALSGRKHSAEKALKAIETVKGVDKNMVINIDLLSGLAGETNETWLKSIDTAIGTGVENITVYRMEVYLNTEFFNKSVRKKQIQLPSEAEEIRFMELAMERFGAADYRPWSFFTFTPGGGHHHHYAGNIWKGEDCFAFGSSGFGQLGNYNYQNSADLGSYISLIGDGKLPIIRAHRITSKDMMVKDIMLGMKLASFDRGRFVEKHGFDFCDVISDTVEELRDGGFIRLEDDLIVLDRKGILYGDYVGKRLAFAMKKYLGLDALNLF